MTVIGYAVSCIDRDLSVQKAALRAAGCKVIRTERRSSATTRSQKQLRNILELLRNGDVLMVTRIDRLALNIRDLQDIVWAISAKGASLRATEQFIDTSIVAGKAFLDMLGLFAEFETNLRKERQLESIAKAKAEGRYKGRPISIDFARVHELKLQGKGVTDIAKEMKIARSSVYRALKEPHEMSPRQSDRRQTSGRYELREPPVQCSEGIVQLEEGELLDVRSERTFQTCDLSQTAIAIPGMYGGDRLSLEEEKNFETLRFEAALAS